MEMAASETSHFPTVSSHQVISDILIAEVHLESGAVLVKAFWTSDPTLALFLVLSEICNRANTMIVSLLLKHLSIHF